MEDRIVDFVIAWMSWVIGIPLGAALIFLAFVVPVWWLIPAAVVAGATGVAAIAFFAWAGWKALHGDL